MIEQTTKIVRRQNFSYCADSNSQTTLLPLSRQGSRIDLGCTLASGPRWDVRELGCPVCRQEHIPGGGWRGLASTREKRRPEEGLRGRR